MDTFIVKLLADLFCILGNWLIIILAVINFIVWFKVKRINKETENMFNPKNDRVNNVRAAMEWDNYEISYLKKIRKRLIVWYTWYANFTAIFPLLGILGTVAALVTYSNETMMDNFMIALGTTLLGVLFAILFKLIDAKISGPLDVFIDDADNVIREYDRDMRGKNEE